MIKLLAQFIVWMLCALLFYVGLLVWARTMASSISFFN